MRAGRIWKTATLSIAGAPLCRERIDAATAGDFIDGPHSADGEALAELDFIEGAERGKVALELEGQFDGGDLFGIAMGEVGDIAFADVRAVAVGLAEIDGLIGFAVGRGPEGAGDVHVYMLQGINRYYNINIVKYSGLCMSTN